MKAAKRVTLLALTFILVFALAACGSKNASSSDDGGQAQDNTQSQSTASDTSSDDAGKTDASADAAPKLDLGGRTITIAAYFDPAPKDDSVVGKRLIAQQKKVEEEYNVKIQYMNVPYGDVTKKLTSSVLSGKPFADMVRLSYGWAIASAGNKEIQPISDIAPDFRMYKNIQAKDNIFGKDYGFDTPLFRASGIWYNRDIFKKLNLPDPHQLVQDGQWTWDKFEELAKKATVDTNSDGKNDYWGVAGGDGDLLQFTLSSNGASMIDLSNGKVHYTDPKVVEALNFEQKLWNVDHVWKVMPESSPDNWKERDTFKDGDVAMKWGYEWEHDTWKGIDLGFVPFPKGPSAEDWSSPLGMAAWFIPAGVEDPKAVIAVYNALQDIESDDEYPGQSYWETHFDYPEDIDVARMLTTKLYAPPYQSFDNGKIGIYDILTKVVVQNQEPTSVLKSHEQEAQAFVNGILHTNN